MLSLTSVRMKRLVVPMFGATRKALALTCAGVAATLMCAGAAHAAQGADYTFDAEARGDTIVVDLTQIAVPVGAAQLQIVGVPG